MSKQRIEKNVQIIIDSLNIQEIAARSKGFTYADKNYRLIFINENGFANTLIFLFCSVIYYKTKIKTRLRLKQLIFVLNYTRKISKICLSFANPFSLIKYKINNVPHLKDC